MGQTEGIVTINVPFNGKIVATIKYPQNHPDQIQISYLHLNYLGTPVIITDANGEVTQTIKRDAWGEVISNTNTVNPTEFGFTGHRYDADSALTYAHARYYSGANKVFLSEDPSFIEMGNPNAIKQFTSLEQNTYLANPQQFNSYSYATNNPVTKMDQSGNFAFLIPVAAYAIAYAPVWVPATITAVATIGAVISTWHLGQEVGYLSVGDNASAEVSSAKVDNSLMNTFVGTSGMFEVGEALNIANNSSKNSGGKYPCLMEPDETGERRNLQVTTDGKFRMYVNGERRKPGSPLDFVLQDDQLKFGENHSYISRGGNVDFAGKIKFNGNKTEVTSWSNDSGHYKPQITDVAGQTKVQNVFKAQFPTKTLPPMTSYNK